MTRLNKSRSSEGKLKKSFEGFDEKRAGKNKVVELQDFFRAEMDPDRTAAINSLDHDAKTDIEGRADPLPQPLKSVDEPLGPSSRQTKSGFTKIQFQYVGRLRYLSA